MAPDSNDGDPLRIARAFRRARQPAGVPGRARRHGRRRSPTPCGAWGTWWATAPSPTSASSLPRSAATSAWRATTTSASWARSTSRTSHPTRPPPRCGRARTRRGTLDFLRAARAARSDGEAIGLYHASPRDPVWEYVLSTAQADECMDAMRPRVGAIGHTHVALRFTRSDARRRRRQVAGRHRAGHLRRRLADQPRQRRAAARRRPARGLAAAGHRELDRALAPRRVPDRRGGGGHRGGGPAAQPRRQAVLGQ